MTEPTSTLSPITTQVLNVILPILAAFLTTLAGMGIAAAKKYLDSKGLQVDAQQFYQQRAIAEAAVLFAEEYIESAFKAAGSRNTPSETAAEKTEIAVNQITQRLPDIGRRAATALVKEALGRIPGLGASGNVQAAPR